MTSSTLFIISALALLASAAAQCGSASAGSLIGIPTPFNEITVPAGPTTVHFPDPCNGMQLVGLKVTACSSYPPAPVVNAYDPQDALVNSNYGATVDGVAYCTLPFKHAAGGHKPVGHHHSRIVLAGNQYV